MTKLRFFTLFIFLGINLCTYAQDTFIRELTVSAEKAETTASLREKAVTEIKRILSDELGSYIITEAKHAVSEDNTGVKEQYKSKTQSFSLALMKTRIIEEKRRTKLFYIKVAIDINDKALKKDLSDAGFADTGNVLAQVFTMLRENNVVSVSNRVINATANLLNGMSIMECDDTGEQVYKVNKNFQGQILNGDALLSGQHKIIYTDASISVFDLHRGYLNGLYRRFNSNNILECKGRFKANERDGLWENYEVKRNKSYLTQTDEYKNGMKNGKSSKMNIFGTLLQVYYYKDDMPISAEIYKKKGAGVFKGALDKFGKKEGEWSYFENDTRLSRLHYKAGERDGRCTYYYASGKVKEDGNYKNGKAVGMHKEFYDNGRLMQKREYSSDIKRTADTLKCYENGNPELSYVYNYKTGIKTFTSYYEEGNIESEKSFLTGDKPIEHGKHISYYQTGGVKEEISYNKKIPVGLHAIYFADGSVHHKENNIIIDGQSVKDGELIDYDNHKRLRKKLNYKKGAYDGLQSYYSGGVKRHEEYYKNGTKLWRKTYYSSGNLDEHDEYPAPGKPCIRKTYHSSGQLETLAYIMPPKEDDGRYYGNTGEYKRYSASGVLMELKNYNAGEQDGLSVYYDDAGNIKKSQMYVSGKRHGIFKAYTGGKLTEYGKCQDNKRVGVWYAISVNTDKLYETTYGDNGRISSKTYDDPEAITKIIKRLKNM